MNLENLPAELRLKIWDLCWEPRCVIATWQYADHHAGLTSTTKPPNTLWVCREWRYESLQRYKLRFGRMQLPRSESAREESASTNTNADNVPVTDQGESQALQESTIYFNRAIDTLHLLDPCEQCESHKHHADCVEAAFRIDNCNHARPRPGAYRTLHVAALEIPLLQGVQHLSYDYYVRPRLPGARTELYIYNNLMTAQISPDVLKSLTAGELGERLGPESALTFRRMPGGFPDGALWPMQEALAFVEKFVSYRFYPCKERLLRDGVLLFPCWPSSIPKPLANSWRYPYLQVVSPEIEEKTLWMAWVTRDVLGDFSHHIPYSTHWPEDEDLEASIFGVLHGFCLPSFAGRTPPRCVSRHIRTTEKPSYALNPYTSLSEATINEAGECTINIHKFLTQYNSLIGNNDDSEVEYD